MRSISGSVSKTWNSINPATLSGAIDVIVIEQEDGECLHALSCGFMILMLEYVCRNSCLFAVPCPIREILSASSLREEGTYS